MSAVPVVCNAFRLLRHPTLNALFPNSAAQSFRLKKIPSPQ